MRACRLARPPPHGRTSPAGIVPETRILVQHHLDRAREALAEAILLLDRAQANTAGNRLYYACFSLLSAASASVRRSALDMRAAAPGQRLLQTAADVDAYRQHARIAHSFDLAAQVDHYVYGTPKR